MTGRVNRSQPWRCPMAQACSDKGIETCYDCEWLYECYYFDWQINGVEIS